MGNKKYSLIKGTNVEIDSSNITGKLIKVNGILNQKTREQVNGTTVKSENINVNDVTIETGRLDFFGNLQQETREGYNKLDIADVFASPNVTINESTHTNIKVQTTDYSAVSAIYFRAKGLKAGVTYTITCITDLLSGSLASSTGRLELYNSDNTAWIKQIGSFNSSIMTSKGTFSVDTDGDYNIRYLLTAANVLNATLQLNIHDFMIYEGTVATDYEQYGVSPSPDYPGEIKVVGDNVNLLNKNTVTKGKYISNGTISTNANYCYSDYIEVIPNEKYVWNTSDGSIGTFICFYDKDKTYISGTSSVKNISVKTPENCKYVIISFDMRFLDNAKLEKGTVATGYTSYGNGGIDAKISNSNMFDANKGNFSHNGLTFTYNSDKSISIKGTTTGNMNVTLSTSNFPIAKSGKTYTKWVKVDGTINSNGTNVILAGRNSTGVNYYNDTWLVSNKTSKFTRVANEDMLMNNINLFVSNSGAEFDCTLYIMFYQGEDEINYEPHKSQSTTIELPEGQFLAKLGNYEDSIDNSGLLKKWIGKKVFDGTEAWVMSSAYVGSFYLHFKDLELKPKTNSTLVCSHAKNVSNVNDFTVGTCIATESISLWLSDGSEINTLELWKSYLAEQYANGTPVEIYYVLKNYSTVELSEASQIKMNYLAKLPMYLPITNVYSEDTISPFFRLRYNYVPALPNPDEFSPISVVGDNINLFNLNSVEIGSNCTYNINDNSIVVKATGTNAYVKSKTYNLSAGSYNLSGSATSDDYKGVAIYVNGSYFDSVASSNLEKIFTLTEDSEVVFRFYASSSSSSTSATAIYSNIKIEKGTIATGYTSYGNGGFDYKAIGKNLFNFKAFFENCLTTRCTKTLLENGIKIDFTAGADAWIGNTINANISIHPYEKAGCIKVKPNTRYVMQMSSAPKCFISFLDKNYIAVRSFITIPNTYKKSTYAFYTTSDTHYLYFRFGITDSNYTSYSFTDIQLAQEMTVSDYEPYKEQISTIELPNGEFMAKIGDVQDYIDNTGVLHKYIKKIILTGEEAWATNMNAGWTENKHVFGITNYEIETNGQSTDTGIVLASSHYKATNTSVLVFSKNDCISYYPANSRIVINHRNINNVTDFKAWLAEQYAAGTPVEIYYITNEPYTVDLSDEDYTKIQSVPMLIDYNNISLEPENNEFVLVYEGDEIEKSYDVTITDSGKLQPFGLTIDYNKTNLPLIAEAYEASQIITGADGDVVLNTTYGPRMFEITAVTDDYLTAEEKEAKREEIREFLNAIKNKTAKLIIEPLNRTFEVKYSGVAEDNNLPKCVEFVIPLKSSNSYAISNETYSHIGSGDFDSKTVEPAGCKITITGPANVPNININGYDVIWNNVLAEGQKLIIDSKKSTVTRVSSLGVKTNVMAYYSHQFPKIQKGVNFVEIISGIEDSQLKIEWNDLLL